MKNILIIIFSIILCSSCNKQKATTNDTEKPILTMAEPNSSDTIFFHIDPELHIEFTATDNIGLHQLSVKLLDVSSNLLFSAEPYVNDLKAYSYHTHYLLSGIISSTTMKVMIDAMDHAGNNLHQEIFIFIEP